MGCRRPFERVGCSGNVRACGLQREGSSVWGAWGYRKGDVMLCGDWVGVDAYSDSIFPALTNGDKDDGTEDKIAC